MGRAHLANFVAILSFASAAVAATDGLPAADCVRGLRAARLRAEAGDVPAARAQAEAATELAGCELAAMTELMRLLRMPPIDEPAASAWRERLVPRLADPALPVPPGLFSLLVALGGSAAEDELLLDALDRRDRAAAPTGPPARATIALLDARQALERRLGRTVEARATLVRLIGLDDSQLWSWQLVALDLELERWSDLAPTLERMLRVAGAPASLRELYVTVLARLGRFEEMSAQLDLLTVPSTTDADPLARGRYLELLMEAAFGLRDAGCDAEAETIFRRALALEPAATSARLALLHLYGSAEERAAHEAAIAEKRAGEEDPQVLYEEGSQLLAAGDPATALDLLARAAPGLEGSRFAEAAWYNLGLAAFKLEDWTQAASAFGEAVRLNPTRADAQFQLGFALYRAERCAEAIAPLERSLELAPGRNETHYFLAACHAANGDTAAAARESELYRRGQPRS